ncbi:MAG: NAD+ synthase [Nitrosomonadales bacterium]|nr:NAD+ synthase [Nitrosomonadales bacterium]
MKISLAQINPTVGDINYNYKLIIRHAKIAQKSGAEILITPELSICGYPPEDLLLNKDFIKECNNSLVKIAKKFPTLKIIVGHPRSSKGLLFNSASILHKGKIEATYDKQILPNYGVFDEKRYFKAGNKNLIFSHKGKKFGLLICEDLWVKGPAEKLPNVDYTICINASPYEINKPGARISELNKRFMHKKLSFNRSTLIYLNLVGGQDDLLFDGGSFIYKTKFGKVFGVLDQLEQFESINKIIDTKPSKHSDIAMFNSSFHTMKIEHPNKIKSQIKVLLDGLILALKDYLSKNSIKNVFIGLSGGIDSAVVLYIASQACKKENITAIMMPSTFTSKASLEDAKKLAVSLGVTYKTKNIQPLMKLFDKTLTKDFKGLKKDITEENIQARIRGVLLMAYANKFNGIVLSTSNKSEVAVGYSTVYGDMVGGFSVLKDVPKTLVYKIANEINCKKEIIPKRIIERPPSAELSKNQTDQDNLPDYDILDEVLDLYIEKNQSPQAIIKKGFSAQIVKKVVKLVNANEFKRRQAAPGPKVTNKAFGKDRRYPITSKYKP